MHIKKELRRFFGSNTTHLPTVEKNSTLRRCSGAHQSILSIGQLFTCIHCGEGLLRISTISYLITKKLSARFTFTAFCCSWWQKSQHKFAFKLQSEKCNMRLQSNVNVFACAAAPHSLNFPFSCPNVNHCFII